MPPKKVLQTTPGQQKYVFEDSSQIWLQTPVVPRVKVLLADLAALVLQMWLLQLTTKPKKKGKEIHATLAKNLWLVEI